MTEPLITGTAPAGQHPKDIVNIVQQFMLASMASDRATTDRYLASNAVITFTGGGNSPNLGGRFNAGRYRWGSRDRAVDVTYEEMRSLP
jgi:hypothetical protein